jgi:hypothetical protein
MQTIAVYNSHTNFASRFFHTLGKLCTGKRLFFTLIAVLIGLFALYVYFINATVQNVVAYGALQRQVNTLSLVVDTLQSQDISLKSGVSLTMAHSAGYEDVNSPQFINLGNSATAASAATLSYKYP